MQNCIRFHEIEFEIGLSEEFWKKWDSSALYRVISNQIVPLLFLKTSILYINFCALSCTSNRDKSRKGVTLAPLV